MPEIGTSAEDKQVYQLYASGSAIGRTVIAPPGMPPERVKILRDAFNATVKDRAFLAEAERTRLHLDPVSGEDVAKALAAAYAVPADLVEVAKETLGEK